MNDPSIEFLLRVWNLQCKPGDYVCLSAKGSKWVDYSFPWTDNLADKLNEWLTVHRHKNLYFCPLPFSEPRRNKKSVCRSRLLWSDIDGANPYKSEPSILWESSPGRYQGLWILPDFVTPDEAAEYSRRMAYYLGADKGGWDLTQVLRIPGTPNLKYDDKPIVKLIHARNSILKEVPHRPIDRWRSTIPRKTLRTIEGPAQQGKRSEMLWFLEHELCDLGIPLADVIMILKESEWNKYRGREDEDERFQSEMDKIKEDRGEKKVATRTESVIFQVMDYGDLMSSSQSSPGWLVRDFWLRNSHGIIAGEPKSFKSTLALDMLYSVASDKQFLGQYPVEYGGPVLIVQNENADWIMKDRLEKLAFNRGEIGNVRTGLGKRLRIEWARNLPIFFVNQQGFTLDDAANKEALEDLIRTIRPAAINLDPLYLMFSGDVNSAKDLNPVLNWCLYIKQEYDCSVILIHHYNKGGESKRGGQRMLGSTTLHGWIESAWYLQGQDSKDGHGVVTMEREFRGASIYPKLNVELDIGEFADTRYNVSVSTNTGKDDPVDVGQTILDILGQCTSMEIGTLCGKVGVDRGLIEKAMAVLIRSKLVKKSGSKYSLL